MKISVRVCYLHTPIGTGAAHEVAIGPIIGCSNIDV